eukprot:scaffold146542_cov36-Tisochrysis_lutea.AAC.2
MGLAVRSPAHAVNMRGLGSGLTGCRHWESGRPSPGSDVLQELERPDQQPLEQATGVEIPPSDSACCTREELPQTQPYRSRFAQPPRWSLPLRPDHRTRLALHKRPPTYVAEPQTHAPRPPFAR